MGGTISLPIWLFGLILIFAGVTFASHFLFPSVRWFFRRRAERLVTELNKRLARPIEPFKLARRYDTIQRLIYDPIVTEAVVAHAKERGLREDVAFEDARRYAQEIVPSFSALTYFSIGIRLARWLATMLYDVRTGETNREIIAALPEDSTVIFVMNHRSNMDYVLVTYLAGEESALSYAVGEWARVWPISRLIRMMGGYFIRRRLRGALYRAVLARYVDMATRSGVTQAIFPEGGLSLDGRLAKPKMGLLSYAAQTHREGGASVVFVPVAINYDRVLEDRVLIAAGKRGDRRFGARISVVGGWVLNKIWLRIRGKFLRFGTAAVIYGEPIEMASYADTVSLEEISEDLMRAIGETMPVLGVPFVAQELLTAPASREELVARGEEVFGTAVETTIDAALSNMKQREIIEASEDVWRANPEETAVLSFYASSVSPFAEEQEAATE
ncbi:MAG: 1-acyl-sn-glycerol-3-phosphate acyltransferase [Rhodobacteraceae bacterium]|nr:1-acyl-sn-glycerol-3-phosphate acyltransferase [Paracoccaceae bacterium]